jgi:hypothetical protein
VTKRVPTDDRRRRAKGDPRAARPRGHRPHARPRGRRPGAAGPRGRAALVLLPRFPSGELGDRWLRAWLADPIGWGAWALPWPFLALGGLFLLRRSPPRLAAGAARLPDRRRRRLVAPHAARAGRCRRLGRGAAGLAAGAAGVLAFLPAVLLVGLGVELIVGWRPSRIVRTALGAGDRGPAGRHPGLWRARVRARARAAFRADVGGCGASCASSTATWRRWPASTPAAAS